MYKRLKDVAVVRFSNVDKISRAGERPVRLCNYTDVYNNDYITAGMAFMEATATHSEIGKFGLRVGDVLLTKDSETPNDIGIPTVVDETADDLVCGYHLALIRPDTERVDPTYLSKQLAHHRIAGYFGQQANGSTRYGLSTASIEQAPLDLPRIEDQVAIGRILRLVDDAIQKTEAVIAKLKQIRAGMLHDLLTYGLDKDGKLRDPIIHPEQFKDSELGRIPKEWEVCSLGRISTLITKGTTPTTYGHQYVSEGIPFLRVEDLTDDGVIMAETALRITQEAHTFLLRSQLRAGDLLISIAGTIGRTAVVSEAHVPCNCNQALALIRFTEGRVKSDFAKLFLAWDVGHRLLVLDAVQLAQANLSLGQVAKCKLPVPGAAEQERIVATVDDANSVIQNETDGLEKLQLLKAGLMDDLLSGVVPVPDNIVENEEAFND